MTEIQPGAVTLADLFRVLSQIQGDLAQMSTRLEVINARNAHADALDADHETRIRLLEAFRWKLVGIALGVSAVSGALGAWVGILAGHH